MGRVIAKNRALDDVLMGARQISTLHLPNAGPVGF